MLALQPWDQLTRLTSYPLYEVVAELVLIWLAVFLVWRFVQGTRAAGAIRGLLVIVLITLAVRLVAPAEMFQRLAFLYDNFLGFAALALVIIFQPELRRAMIRLGETAMFRQTPSDVAPVIDALVSSCTFLSKNKFGAIMAIERQVGLRETIEGGSQLNADVSAELLNSIFWPNNPLHDMGVVIRGPKVVAAGVQFPLADPQEMTDPRLGTRHRAAVGLSRVGDAIVIVVSEENGAISLAERGQLQRWVTPESLREELRKRLA
ncbi:MAG: diadenylate cyclase CdaA, partial [Planctomycetota bacterium]|nr:diadenylate cyclase CdaA [Planctomycetota bacterium]